MHKKHDKGLLKTKRVLGLELFGLVHIFLNTVTYNRHYS